MKNRLTPRRTRHLYGLGGSLGVVRKKTKKAGDETRTRNVQLGRLVTHLASGDEQASYERSTATTSNSPSSSDEKPPDDANLQDVIEAWPTLPEAIRAGILAMVRSQREG